MFLAVVLFLLGLLLLVKGGDWFVEAASAIAHRFHMPELLIGATVVSIGTTLPEVMVSAQGALRGSGAIAFGNSIGSIICNTSLIAAITLAARPASISRKTFLLPACAFFIAAAYYCFNAYAFKAFSRTSGILLLIGFAAYILTTIRCMKKSPDPGAGENAAVQPLPRVIAQLALGALSIAGGAQLTVDNAQMLAAAAGIPESVIALTLVALGTSLPELVTAITSLMKGCAALSLGNIIGANLFNLTLVSGTAITISPFSLAEASASSMRIDIPVMLFVSALLIIPALIREKTGRWQGVFLLIVYAAYCVFLFTAV